MRIVIETVPHLKHRYDTLGDYWRDPDGAMRIRVSDLGDWRLEALVAVHELVEFALCEARGIPEPTIKAFDEAHPDSDEPGALADAPYRAEHAFAEKIERMLCREFGIPWSHYEKACETPK